jgi:hypothetical protein
MLQRNAEFGLLVKLIIFRLAPSINIGHKPDIFIEALVIFLIASSPILEWLLLYMCGSISGRGKDFLFSMASRSALAPQPALE